MTDNTKSEFSRAVAEFGAWKLLPKADRTRALPWWWAACIPLLDSDDLLPENLSIALGGASTYSDGVQTFRKQLVSEVGAKPPESGWSGR